MTTKDPRSSINQIRMTFEYLQYYFLKDTNVNGKPMSEITAIEVDHNSRLLRIYYQGDIQRAEGQECPLVMLKRDQE